MPTYADYTHVAGKLPHRAIGPTTTPSSVDVNLWLDEAEAEVNGVLAQFGVTVPVTGPGVPLLRKVVVGYGVGTYRQAYATAYGDGPDSGAEDILQRYEDTIQHMRRNPTEWAAMLAQGDAPAAAAKARSYTTNLDAADYEPLFKIKGENF